jgi:hypothetical protein
MSPPIHESREAQAAREVGRTDVAPAVARALTAVFALVLASVPGLELACTVDSPGAPWSELATAPQRARQAARRDGLLRGNRALISAMNAFEDALEERSIVARWALPHVQRLLTGWLEVGNEQVVLGRDGWLYFRPALDHLTGRPFLAPRRLARRAQGGEAWKAPPRPDPLPAIADFAAQLAERGIGLVVVVTPVKAALHPEGLAPHIGDDALPLRNPSLGPFLERLAELEIPAYAPDADLAGALRRRGWPQFLRTDTHWTPQAMEQAAEGLAGFLRGSVTLPEREPAVFLLAAQEAVEGRGDLFGLLSLPADAPILPAETALIRPVRGPDGAPWAPDPDAHVLVLGDSFVNVFSQAELGWGSGAGFAEHLSHRLQRPVDKLAVNAGGPAAVRERLAAELAAGVDRLAETRLVVYQFTARELSAGDWRLVDLDPARSPSTGELRQRPEDGVPARGTAVWESNRTGDWRIWMRRLEGSPPRQLSPEEPGRQHCCPHLSPDGRRLVYLSREVPKDEYPEPETAGQLRLLEVGTGRERTLTDAARVYGWGNRAAVWRDDHQLVHVRGDGRTALLDVDSGATSLLTRGPASRRAWLLDPTLRHAVNGTPTFSRFDAERGLVEPGPRRTGCEPYFSADGRFGFWVASGGGPIRWLRLEDGATGTLLEQRDPRIPGAQRYAYFPMLDRSGRVLAFGASQGDHDHALSNYDVFVAPLAPDSLELLGRPLRLTAYPASDRYPDLHLDSIDLERWRRLHPPDALPGDAPAPPEAAGEPFEVTATLVTCSRTPSLREISPYRAALIVCEWRLRETLSLDAPGERVRAAHWAIRDGERLPIAGATPESEARLRLEPFRGLAQVEGQPLFDTLPRDPALPLHYSPDSLE